MIIDSQISLVPGAPMREYRVDAIKNEPMLFNCSMDGAYHLGGDITKAFIARLPEDWRTVPLVIDSRVHMLMPGWYPCIPGWHHDDVPRTRSDGQPNYDEGQNRSEHIMLLINGDICPTEFALGVEDFKEPKLGRTIYSDWHQEIEARDDVMNWPHIPLTRVSAPSGRLIRFNDRTWHRGTAAVANGWRFFIRASRYYDPDGNTIPRGNPRTNEVRKQVQVYMEAPNAGW